MWSIHYSKQEEKSTALMLAAKGGHIETVQVLIDAGTEVNSVVGLI